MRTTHFLLLYYLILTHCVLSTTSSTVCIPRHEFQCQIDGSCISMKKWQDGVDDCYDASDEVCLPWQFDCQFGSPRCISKNKLNDGIIDCYSGFDEGCPSHYFVCRDRSDCIEPSKYLNGVADCKDKSDEPCPQNQFQCADGEACIPKERVQDGKDDCKDGSDEQCTTSQFACQCGVVRCVTERAVLDGIWDCEDGSDEFLDNTNLSVATCKKKLKPNTRTNLLNVSTAKLCAGDNPCKPELGEVCVVIGGTWRCVCKLGTVRPLGSKKCIPLELLKRFRDSPSQNCSDQSLELFGLVKGMISAQRGGENTIRRSPAKTISGTTLNGIDGFLNFGRERVPFMFQKDEENVIPDEVIDSYGTSMIPTSDNQCIPDSNSSCGVHQKCRLQSDGAYRCDCRQGFVMIEGNCEELIDECKTGKHDCHSEALCVDAVVGFECLCREGFLDTSLEPRSRPGRKCLKLINECLNASLNDCSQHAKCLDKPIGYTCRCQDGHVDVSSMGAAKPGRNCTQALNECATNAHTCHPKAVCIDLPVGYSCRCPHGFVDVSPSLPGRKCTPLAEKTSQCTDGSKNCKCLPGYIDKSANSSMVNCQREKRE